MAKLFPLLASVTRNMTSGERRLAARLESHLEDDYLCWYDVPIGAKRRHPDFVVLHPRRGILILEVKDWKLDSIRRIDPLTATLLVNGREKRESNPLEQGRQYAQGVCQLLESDPALIGAPGTPYQGRLLFPWGYGVVLANITRKAFMATDLSSAIPPGRVICQDEMTEASCAEEFQQRLWGMFSVTFPCVLSMPQIDRIRWHLFPEVRVTAPLPLEPEAATNIGIPDVVRVMDLQQEQLARSMGEGHRVIHGVAGSGKTMILGYRAQQLAQVLEKPVLVLCYNRTLAANLQHTIRERGLSRKVSVRSFHGWCSDQLSLYHVPRPEGNPPEVYDRMVEAVIRGVARGQIPRAQYGAVLIDEGHDFQPEWLRLVVQMVDPDTSSVLVLYDDAQSINRPKKGRLKFSFSEVGIQARGRTTILRLNYRNTAEVMQVACDFAREVLSPAEAGEDGIPLLAPESCGRRGPRPELICFADLRQELDFVVERAQALHQEGVAWREMAVLYRADFQGRRIGDELRKARIPFATPGASREKYRPGDDSVKVITMHSSKGLEFPVVFVPWLDAMPCVKDDFPGEAKLLYVAMTRAMDRLILTHHGESPFVRRLRDIVGSSARQSTAALGAEPARLKYA